MLASLQVNNEMLIRIDNVFTNIVCIFVAN